MNASQQCNRIMWQNQLHFIGEQTLIQYQHIKLEVWCKWSKHAWATGLLGHRWVWFHINKDGESGDIPIALFSRWLNGQSQSAFHGTTMTNSSHQHNPPGGPTAAKRGPLKQSRIFAVLDAANRGKCYTRRYIPQPMWPRFWLSVNKAGTYPGSPCGSL